MRSPTPERVDIQIQQGATFAYALQWMQERKVFAAITGMPSRVPVRLTATAHGMPDDWPCRVSGVQGCLEVNSVTPDDLYIGYKVDADTVELLNVNGNEWGTYSSGGYLEYWMPYDLSQYTTGSCVVRKSQGTTDVLFTLAWTTGVVVDNVAKTITLQMAATDTAALTYGPEEGWYDLDLTHTSGAVHRVSYGRMALQRK